MGKVRGRSPLSSMRAKGDAKLSTIELCANQVGMNLEELVALDFVQLKPSGGKPAVALKCMKASGNGLGSEILDCLNRQRFTEPQTTLRVISALAERAEPSEADSLLLTASECFKSLFDFDKALWCLHFAGKSEEKDLRLISFNACIGALDRAIAIAKKLVDSYSRKRQLGGIGEALVAEASCMLARKNPAKAEEKFRQSLLYSEDGMRANYLGAAYHGLAICLLPKRAVEEAGLCFERALRCFQAEDNEESVAKVIWGTAGLVQDGADRLEEAMRRLPKHCIIDRALLAIDLSISYLEKGLKQEATIILSEFFSVLDELAFIPTAQRVIEDIINLALKEQLDIVSCLEAKKEVSASQSEFFDRLAEKLSR